MGSEVNCGRDYPEGEEQTIIFESLQHELIHVKFINIL